MITVNGGADRNPRATSLDATVAARFRLRPIASHGTLPMVITQAPAKVLLASPDGHRRQYASGRLPRLAIRPGLFLWAAKPCASCGSARVTLV